MALIVEDGTGKSDAESFIAVADATTYHAARGNAAWAALASDTVREQMLRKATDYMEQVYRQRWKGQRVTATQALSWPRAWVSRDDYYRTGSVPPDSIDGSFYYPSDEVPAEVARACAELALRAIDGDLAADQETPVTSETVGPISVTYAEGARQSKIYPAVAAMLAPFLEASGGRIKVSRA
jgi:hypothetical protein